MKYITILVVFFLFSSCSLKEKDSDSSTTTELKEKFGKKGSLNLLDDESKTLFSRLDSMCLLNNFHIDDSLLNLFNDSRYLDNYYNDSFNKDPQLFYNMTDKVFCKAIEGDRLALKAIPGLIMKWTGEVLEYYGDGMYVQYLLYINASDLIDALLKYEDGVKRLSLSLMDVPSIDSYENAILNKYVKSDSKLDKEMKLVLLEIYFKMIEHVRDEYDYEHIGYKAIYQNIFEVLKN